MTSNPGAAVDRSVIDGYRTMADDAFVAGIVEQYLTEAAASVADIEAAVTAGAAARLAEAAHSLRGASATIGARTVSALCAEIEELARRGDLTGVANLCAALAFEFARARDDLRALLAGGGDAIN